MPDIGTADGLPVVVWIHGGGYEYYSHVIALLAVDNSSRRYDSGNVTAYPPADLVTDSQNRAIAVSIQYRLGAFGKVRLPCQFSAYWNILKAFWLVLPWRERVRWMPGCVRIPRAFQEHFSHLIFGIVDQNFALQWVQKYVRAGIVPIEFSIWLNATIDVTDLVCTSLGCRLVASDLGFGH